MRARFRVDIMIPTPTSPAVHAASALTLLLVLGALNPATAVAGEYRLIEGQGKDVCEAYRKNLEPRNDPMPMACERDYNPAIAGFSSPQWHKLEIQKNRRVFLRGWIYLQRHHKA